MRILAFSDIHNDWHTLRYLAAERANLYLCAGDLTYSERGIEKAANILSPINDRLFIVPGNNERPKTLEQLFPNAIHGRVIEFEGLRIGGFGGSKITPWNTPCEWEDDYAFKILEKLGETDIFIAHSPPSNTGLALTSAGIDVGSEAIRWYIEKYQPKYAVVGHVHERAGLVETIGKTVVLNPGPKGKLFEI